ncbi:ABC transporter permease [Mesorhizobium helmanticense]|uniref:Peptide ABC transporter n=1 Tax=Mesorhizobium helmanticense TaxID=1776423 RepID=A0A2T4IKU8_9HYPH|nr:ABC transporter permease [Mesorhizobium helmanticense]PTE06252.1 peptide ABC transporter [Mesorhizobium helmanticense]
MPSYTLRRAGALLPVLLVVSIVIFSLAYLTPGDPASTILGPEALEADVQNLRDSMGLNDPFLVQYFRWIWSAMHGDLGTSYFLKMSVAQAIGQHFLPTMQLAVLTIFYALVVSIPLGVLAARWRGSFFDHGIAGFTLIGLTFPSFVLSLILVIVFSVCLHWLPVAGYRNPFSEPWNGMRYLILPTLSLGTIYAAVITRTVRASVLDVLKAEYVDSARSRGVSESRLLFAHALRNAGLPIITMIGLSFASLVSGAVVAETVFNIPGIGSLLVNAIQRRDYPVAQGVVLFLTLLYLLLNLLVDLLYGLIDPRVRLSDAGAK